MELQTTTRALLTTACLVLLVGPALAHVGSGHSIAPGAQLMGHSTVLPNGGLNAFQFVGPAGTPLASKPCLPVTEKLIGASDVDGANAATHWGHLVGIRGGQQLPDLVDFFHVDGAVYGSPKTLENSWGGGNTLLGHDGYLRARFASSVTDAPGPDLRLYDVHNFSTVCAYASPNANGPWLLLGTGLRSGFSFTDYDMAWFYNDLWQQQGMQGAPSFRHVLLIASIDRAPVVGADWTAAPYDRTTVPYQSYVLFRDASTSEGPADPGVTVLCPMAGCTSSPHPVYNPKALPVNGHERTDPDPITQWRWSLDTDPSAKSTVASCGGHCFTPVSSTADDFPWYFPTPGTYELCLAVTTKGGYQDHACRQVTVFNQPPVARDDAATVAEDSAATPVAVLANDDLGIQYPESGSVALADPPAHGTATLDTRGTWSHADDRFLYTPAADFAGTDTFSYRLSDGRDSDTATVTVTVTPVNDAPVAAGDEAASDGFAVTVDVLANDSDVDGDTLAVASVGAAGSGTTSTDGRTVTYTPAPGFSGEDAFTYTVTDGAAEATATVRVTVVPVDPAPVAVAGVSRLLCPRGAHQFQSDSYEPGDADAVSTLWDFGDGSTSGDRDPAHRYRTAGTYTVTLTVTDDDGQTAVAELRLDAQTRDAC